MFKKSAAPSTGYNLTKSLRFRSSANAYLNRTPGSTSNQTTWTWSGWVKIGILNQTGLRIFDAGSGSIESGLVYNKSGSNYLQFEYYNGSSYTTQCITNASFRDPSSWYHIVVAVDTTQSTSSNRVKIYVNNVLQTLGTATYPSQNATFAQNSSSNANTIGTLAKSPGGGVNTFDGYMAEINFVDGQQLTPSSFGSTNATTGVWQPARYTGTYGTNGFYLPFTNTTSTATLGNDFSGNNNTWTTNNFSLTTGTTYDSMTDVPTLTSATTANYAVLNPLVTAQPAGTASVYALGSGNLYGSATAEAYTASTISMDSGKFYVEFYVNQVSSLSISQCGIATANLVDSRVYRSDGNYNAGAGNVAYGATYTTGDYIGIAVDITNNTIEFYKNNVSQGQKTSISTSGKSWFFWVYSGGGNSSWYANFGQQGFKYTPPAGFVALNTYNLPASTIVNGSSVMDATTYTGNGGSQTVTNASSFKPDLIWIKSRSLGSTDHQLVDSVRGSGYALHSNTTGTEDNYTAYFTSINSNGFSLAGGTNGFNSNTNTYVGWQWQAGQGTTSSNTNGSITSTVSVNATAGFSIVTYTGTGANATVGHGLGVAPSMVIVKNRTNAGSDWTVWQTTLSGTQYLWLDSTAAVATNANRWNSTTPTSTVFSVGASGDTNNSGASLVAYCWTPIAGFSAFGSYTGNGSTDGPFVFTNFQPKFVLIKRTDSANNWFILDTARSSYNLSNAQLLPNSSAAESTNTDCNIDILSNGFKLRTALDASNGSGGSYIWAAFASNPFKNSLAR